MAEDEKETPESSPRMRGAPYNSMMKVTHDRIIPANAGSTPPWSAPAWPGPDHPRECGEHRRKGRINDMGLGSSPRMRGALGLGWRMPNFIGIIPANAGSTRGRP